MSSLSLALLLNVSIAFAAETPLAAVPAESVTLADGFWKTRIDADIAVTIPHNFEQCEKTGRFDNFRRAAGQRDDKFEGYFFNDSDVYKLIEAASLAYARTKDPTLDKKLDDYIALIAAAQEPDGYLYTARTAMGHGYEPPGGKERWSDLGDGHELYCAGHLYEAAVAHFNATGKRTLLDVAIKNADLVCRVFDPQGRVDADGHPEVELALVKLYRATSDKKYLEQAKFFLDVRGKHDNRRAMGEYAQDHQPVREQAEAVGHAVRAAYLYAGMTDVGVLTNDTALMDASKRLWDDVVSSKMYLTGGIGSTASGEAFGPRYDLPNLTAYSETCASIAQAKWSQRLLLLTGDAKYADAVERVLYNGFLAGVSLKGDEFFYVNPLECQAPHRRQAWFGCACCPPNVARFMLEVPGLVYATRGEDEIFVNQYVASETEIKLEPTAADPPKVGETRFDQKCFEIDVATDYPRSGTIKLKITPTHVTNAGTKGTSKTTVNLRIPGWVKAEQTPGGLYRYAPSAADIDLKVNGEKAPLDIANGYARVTCDWTQGDTIEIDLPMPVRRVTADERVRANRGRVALQRGPVVYAVELPEQKTGAVRELLLPDDAAIDIKPEKDLLGGVTTLSLATKRVTRDDAGKIVAITAIPYYAWANRAVGPMAVWLARDRAAARPPPLETVAFKSKVSVSGGGPVTALNDQSDVAKSNDPESGNFHWWPRKGTSEWVQYDFAGPTKISAVEVYWFDDTGIGECRLPKSYDLLAKIDGEWQPLPNVKIGPVEIDQFNRVTFAPVTAEGLRLVVQLADNFSGGINELRVEEAN